MKQLLADRVRGGDVALDFAQRAPLLDGFSDWDWRLESDGASRDADHVRLVSAQVGDPVAIVPPPTLAAPRQLVARVLDAQLWSSRSCLHQALKTRRPRRKSRSGRDIAADEQAPVLPAAPGP